MTVKTTWHGDRLMSKIEHEARRSIIECLIVAEGDAAHLCPVDTGRLRASITRSTENGGLTGKIGTNVEYAPYIEFGTSRSAAQPFLRPAIDDNKDAFDRIFRANMKRAL